MWTMAIRLAVREWRLGSVRGLVFLPVWVRGSVRREGFRLVRVPVMVRRLALVMAMVSAKLAGFLAVLALGTE